MRLFERRHRLVTFRISWLRVALGLSQAVLLTGCLAGSPTLTAFPASETPAALELTPRQIYPTDTPTQASLLASDAKNPDIRGTIVGVSAKEEIIIALHVEGIVEPDTKYDKASVRVTNRTRIYVQTETGFEPGTLDLLSTGSKVEILFLGVILERYPVSAEADEILIIQTGE